MSHYKCTLEDGKEKIEYNFNTDVIPVDALKDVLEKIQYDNNISDGKLTEKVLDDDTFEKIKNIYMKNGRYSMRALSIFKKENIDTNTYDFALKNEDYMRNNMYKEEFKDHPMNTEPYYNLYRVDRELINRINNEIKDNSYDYFNMRDILFKTFKDFNDIKIDKLYIEILDELFEGKYNKNIFVAGGYVYNLMMGISIFNSDIDIFLHSCDPDKAEEIINEIYRLVSEFHKVFVVSRTKNAITFKTNSEFQVILRLYKSPSEILHGFDVDCCCVGYDGEDLWMTKRAYYAFTHSYNTVNFDRLSPTYENRLVKYGKRGMSILVPNIKINNINTYELVKYDKKLMGYDTNKYIKLEGLDKLLVMDHKKSNDKKNFNILSNNAEKLSDYDENTEKISTYDKSVFQFVLLHLMEKNDKYKKYKDFMEKYEDNLLVNSLKDGGRFYYMKMNIEENNQSIDEILHIPDEIYEVLSLLKTMSFEKDVSFKTTNPGEQMTNTFHSIVLENNDKWYNGRFYSV